MTLARIARNALYAGIALNVLACASTSTPFVPQPAGWTEIDWRACPQGVTAGPQATCAHVMVPLDWAEPAERSISLFVRRFTPKDGQTRGQLWALDGGPGDAGDVFSLGWFKETVLAAGFELLVPTHRGVSFGTTLRCDDATGLEQCLEELKETWGHGIRHFDTHQAAKDVVALAKGYRRSTPGEDQSHLIFGGSYGGVWLQHVLVASPGLFDAAYLDSTAPMGSNFEAIGTWNNAVGERLLQRCDEQPACRAQFPEGAMKAAEQVRADLSSADGCFKQLALGAQAPQAVQAGLATLLAGNQERVLVAPALRRLLRCNAQDVVQLNHWLAGSKGPPKAPEPAVAPRVHNGLINVVTLHRENYRPTLSPQALRTLASGLLFDSGAMVSMMERHQLATTAFGSEFPRADAAPGGVLFGGPLHIVQGALDARSNPTFTADLMTLWPNAAKDLVVVLEGGHGSPRFTQLPDGSSCTIRWLTGFLANPSAPFDVGCIDGVPRMDLAGERPETKTQAKEVFASVSVWGE